MPRKCTVCQQDALADINRMLVEGKNLNDIISLCNGNVTKMSLIRHRDNHLPETLTKAREVEVIAHADTLLAQVQELQGKAWSLLTQAERTGDLRAALQGVRETKGCLELLGRLQGQLQQEMRVVVESAEVQQLCQQLVIIIQQEVQDPVLLERIAARLQGVEG